MEPDTPFENANPMKADAGQAKPNAGAQSDESTEKEHRRALGGGACHCSRCTIISSIALIVIVAVAVVLGIVLGMSGDDADVDNSSTVEVMLIEGSTSRDAIAGDACESDGTRAASSGQYSNFAQTQLDIFDSVPSCEAVSPLYNALGASLGVSSDAVILRVQNSSDESAPSRARALHSSSFRRL